MDVITREQIGLRPPVPNTQLFGVVDRITAHYYGGDLRIVNLGDLFAITRGIQNNDMVNKGYSDIMYNLGANPFDSRPLILRGLDRRNAANGTTTGNMVSPSVLFPQGPLLSWMKKIPNWEDNLLSSAMACDELIEKRWGKSLAWVPHSSWRPTSCPGDWALNKLKAFDGRPTPPAPDVWMPAADWADRPIVGGPGLRWDGMVDMGYVRWVQNFFNITSPHGCPVDGVWGPITELRTAEYQSFFGLPRLGFVDKTTWAYIHWIATEQGIV